MLRSKIIIVGAARCKHLPVRFICSDHINESLERDTKIFRQLERFWKDDGNVSLVAKMVDDPTCRIVEIASKTVVVVATFCSKYLVQVAHHRTFVLVRKHFTVERLKALSHQRIQH